MADDDSLTFQVFRFDAASSQAPKIAEVAVPAGFVTGGETVAQVERKLRPRVSLELANAEARPGSELREDDQLSLFFSGRPMAPERLFYADHFILLPAWVQVVVHRPEEAEALRKL